MKTLIIASIITMSTLGIASAVSKDLSNSDNLDCQNGYCLATTKKGNPCKNCAQSGSIYCWAHGR